MAGTYVINSQTDTGDGRTKCNATLTALSNGAMLTTEWWIGTSQQALAEQGYPTVQAAVDGDCQKTADAWDAAQV